MANNTGNKYGGREAGTQNKITKELKALINTFLSEEWEAIKEDFKALEPKDRLIYYEKLLAYCVPKNSPIEIEEARFEEQPIFFNINSYSIDENTIKSMPYEDLRQLILDSKVFMESKQGKDYILNLKSPIDINVVEQGKKTPTIILNLGNGIKPKD